MIANLDRMDLIFCGTGWLPLVDAIADRLPPGSTIRLRDPEAELNAELRYANVILPSNCRIDRSAIAAPEDLRLIQQPAAGFDGVDLAAARELGVPVCNVPDANADAMAELALLLMLALARRFGAASRAFSGAQLGVPVGTELHGKTLGIVGLGRSGSALARIARAMGMEIHSIRSTSSQPERDRLFAESDVVSLHCPLNESTLGSIDAGVFAQMKPGAFLVNCARGPIVERAALEDALTASRLGGVGLDTYWQEPWDPVDPLFGRENVICLPHIGGSTTETFARLADIAVENISRVQRGEELLFRVA